MDRRAFVAGLSAVLAAPLAAEAQQTGKVPIGILVTANPRVYDDFVDQLRKLGYIEGQNLVLDFRSAEGHYDRHPALAVERVKMG
jgi:putative ABC transport system substrate-binding protein